MSLTRTTSILLSLTLGGFLLIYLKSFLIPFVFSLGIWFLIRKFRKVIMKTIKMPFWLGSLLASMVILAVLYFFSELLTLQVKAFMAPENLDKYNTNFQLISEKFIGLVGDQALQSGISQIQDFNLASLISNALGALTNLLGNSFMVILYLLFLILEENVIKLKFRAIYHDESKREAALSIFRQIIKSVENYITLKTLVSIITGLASYFGLLILQIDFPIFWALLIFLLNYIPTIGSLIATLFPTLMALMQYPDQPVKSLLVLIIIGVIQVIVGNVIEPRVMGDNLNISPLVVILSLTLWGTLWGVVGMILSVPIMVVVIIVFSKIPSMRNLAVMMSSNGNV